MKKTGVYRKVDELGRIVIPKKIRKQFDIKDNEILIMSTTEDKIILKKEIEEDKEFKKLLEKVSLIKENFDIDFLIANDYKIIYTTENYKEYINIKIGKKTIKDITYSDKTKITNNIYLTAPHYYCSISFDKYTNGKIFVIFKEETKKDKIKFLINLLR